MAQGRVRDGAEPLAGAGFGGQRRVRRPYQQERQEPAVSVEPAVMLGDAQATRPDAGAGVRSGGRVP
jgi:hypothetical protein